ARLITCDRPTLATITCTAPGATACNACATSTSCRRRARSWWPHRSRSATAAAARCACSPSWSRDEQVQDLVPGRDRPRPHGALHQQGGSAPERDPTPGFFGDL